MMMRVPLVMVVDSGAHNFQISNVKPRLYALFVEKEERLLANVSSQTPTLVWRSHEYNLTQPHSTTTKQLMLFFFCTKMPLVVHLNPLKVVFTMHAIEVTHCAVLHSVSLFAALQHEGRCIVLPFG